MSLVRIAARIALVEALRGRTLVGDNVHDSTIGAFDDRDGALVSNQSRPFIAVYSDSSMSAEAQFRTTAESGTTDFLIEFGIASTMTVTERQTGESHIVPGIPATDDNMEFSLDLIGRQVANALVDPANQWAEIWRDIASGGYREVELRRRANAEDGTRLAGHQLRIAARLMVEPQIGADLPVPFPTLFSLIADGGDAVLQARAALMQEALAGEANDWTAVQRRLGLTAGEVQALGVRPQVLTDDGEAPLLTRVTITPPGTHGEPIEVEAED